MICGLTEKIGNLVDEEISVIRTKTITICTSIILKGLENTEKNSLCQKRSDFTRGKNL
jgi:hypothetical protein